MSHRAGSAVGGTPDHQSGGGGSIPTPALVGKAWQRAVRERAAQEEPATDLFGAWWRSIDTGITRATIKPIDVTQAKSVIEKYEWMGCLAAVTWYAYGIFFDGCLGGAVTYGPEYSENLGKQARERGRKCADWSKYGYEDRMILLSRGACAHWAHPHAASKLIRVSMRMLPPRYEVVTATVDPAAGEIGTIYQACGFHYVGSMREANPNVQFRAKDRHAWRINGKLYGGRAVRAMVGSTRQADILEKYPKAECVMQFSKHRYFAFRGPDKAQRLAAIAHMVKPYPKRSPLDESPRGV